MLVSRLPGSRLGNEDRMYPVWVSTLRWWFCRIWQQTAWNSSYCSSQPNNQLFLAPRRGRNFFFACFARRYLWKV